MTGQPRQPQDFKKKVQGAINLQAANLLQKAQLDMMATKIILVLKEHKGWYMRATGKPDSRKTKEDLREELKVAEDQLGKIGDILSMTRDEAAEARKSFVYPDERIQAVIDEATDKIAAILLEDVA